MVQKTWRKAQNRTEYYSIEKMNQSYRYLIRKYKMYFTR